MTSVQERLQLKRIALDKWTIREQLCLASAVSCSGDQNWMSVSRSLKMLCGANRPADWFSQKSCAVQYGELLENVETPKRKKRTANERDNQTAETPTESILRKLTQERINELKSVIQAEQEEYTKLREEILSIQAGGVEEAQLREMWAQIEQEMEHKQIEKQKHEQWLKEREERKTELQKASRVGLFSTATTTAGTAQSKPAQLSLMVKSEDVETDEGNSKQGSSPLLTSLLKSPATTPTASNSPTNIRATAPTITNLLTGHTNTVISMGATSTSQSFPLMHNQPLTGPVPTEATPQVSLSAPLTTNKSLSRPHHFQVTQSPSQAAPTLSMLLENKNSNKSSSGAEQPAENIKNEQETNDPEPMETEDGSCSPNKDEEQQLMEVFKGLIPDNIDEDIEEILTNNNAIILNPELLEEESILENVDSLIDDHDDISDKDKAMEPQEQPKPLLENSKNMSDSINTCESKDQSKQEKNELQDAKAKPKIEDSSGGGFQGSIEPKNEPQELKSDAKQPEPDSSDPVSDDNDVQIIETTPPLTSNREKTKTPSDLTGRKTDSDNKQPEIATDVAKASPEKKRDNFQDHFEKSIRNESHDHASHIIENTHESHSENLSDHTTTITIIDTDEDSTMEVIKEDKVGKAKRDYSRKKPEHVERRLDDMDEIRLSIGLRKLKDREGSESPLVDDETSDSIPRTRRRYSSTPNIDSIPNSPASSDDREYRAWKKSVLTVYNKICSHKYASLFHKQLPEDSAPNYKQIILRPMDLQTIKHNIESGVIRTTAEFQRDVMLMCQNVMMYYGKENSGYAMAKEMMADMGMAIESLVESARKEVDHRSGNSASSLKNRSRKSTRLP